MNIEYLLLSQLVCHGATLRCVSMESLYYNLQKDIASH